MRQMGYGVWDGYCMYYGGEGHERERERGCNVMVVCSMHACMHVAARLVSPLGMAMCNSPLSHREYTVPSGRRSARVLFDLI